MSDFEKLLNADDRFVLGNVALLAVLEGMGREVLEVVEFLMDDEPTDASPCLLKAVYLDSIGKSQEALDTLETCNVFEKQTAREEATSFHLHLLAKLGHVSKARNLAETYLSDNGLQKESARHMVAATIKKIVSTDSSVVRHSRSDETSLPDERE